MACLRSFDAMPHSTISSSVRRQPTHRPPAARSASEPARASILQIEMQGEAMGSVSVGMGFAAPFDGMEEDTMAGDWKKGDAVTWRSPQGTVSGVVVEKLTSPTDIKGHHVAASKDNPEYLVKSNATGAQAAHKADALTRKD